MVEAVPIAAFGGDHITGFDRYVSRPLLRVIEALAGLLLVADLAVVSASVLYRYVLTAPLVWSDDVARALLLGVSSSGPRRRWRAARMPASPSSRTGFRPRGGASSTLWWALSSSPSPPGSAGTPSFFIRIP